MTTLGNVGAVSVEDRAVECLTAIAYVYEDAMDDLAFLQRTWEAALPASASVARLIATAMSEPLGAADPVERDEPALPEMPVVSADQSGPLAAVPAAVHAADSAADHAADSAADHAADSAVADLATATDLEVVPGSEDDGRPDGLVEQVRVLMIAEAATAEIPVQAAA